jgi:cell division protease FtsH
MSDLRKRLDERTKVRGATRNTGGAARRLMYKLTASLLALLLLIFVALSLLSPHTGGTKLRLDQVQSLATTQRVESATLLDEDSRITGKVKAKPGDALLPGGGAFWMAYPSQGALTKDLVSDLRAGGAQVSTDQQGGKGKLRFLAQFLLPILVLANLFALLMNAGKGSGGAIGEIVSFGSLDKGRTGETPTRFTDVGGADEAVTELAEVRDYLLDPQKYRNLGAAPPKGVLLFGPPGTGKTLLAKAVAGEAGVPFFSVAGAQFVESLVGVGAARVRDLFARVRSVAPAILFIDELDALGRRRGSGSSSGGGSDEREQTLNQLLVEMDGFDVSSGVVVIAATNRPDILDPALLRPGRFDRHITVERPDAEGRERILRIHSKGKPLAPDVDINELAHKTAGFTGADLANVMNEAALLTVRRKATTVTRADLTEAIDRVLSGPRRRGHVLEPDEQRRSAVHEVGHALVSAVLRSDAEVSKLSVLPRGRTVAGAIVTANADTRPLTPSELRARLAARMAGIAAETLVLGEASTGGEDDLEKATAMARDMVARYGMAPELGPVRLMLPASAGYIGDGGGMADVSHVTLAAVDVAVRRLLDQALSDAAGVLRKHVRGLQQLVEDLIEAETLEGDDLADALEDALAADGRRAAPTAGAAAKPGARPAAKAPSASKAKPVAKSVSKTPAKRA